MKVKRVLIGFGAMSVAALMLSCGAKAKIVQKEYVIQTTEVEVPAKDSLTPGYTILEKTQVDLSCFPKDKDGWYTLFDGEGMYGWRGYNRDNVPGKWTIEDGAIKVSGGGAGEAQSKDGGDLVFAHKFKNFELSIDWKVAKGSNSGIFYLAQEIKGQAIYVSAPESQVLDNENHPDAKLGENGNRKSSSLYDMIPADPQNSKPFGEWNNTTIMVFKGTVVHSQNGKNVLEYHLWTPQWTELLQNCKFSQKRWPVAFALLNNCGGDNHEGYIGLQDHGDDVWFKNIKIKILD